MIYASWISHAKTSIRRQTCTALLRTAAQTLSVACHRKSSGSGWAASVMNVLLSQDQDPDTWTRLHLQGNSPQQTVNKLPSYRRKKVSKDLRSKCEILLVIVLCPFSCRTIQTSGQEIKAPEHQHLHHTHLWSVSLEAAEVGNTMNVLLREHCGQVGSKITFSEPLLTEWLSERGVAFVQMWKLLPLSCTCSSEWTHFFLLSCSGL